MDLIGKYIGEGKSEEEITKTIMKFFADNPNPPDEDVHDLAEKLGIDPDDLETMIYKVLTKLLKKSESISEASASQAVERGQTLHDLLMDSDSLDKLKDAHMKVQKEAAKVFQQAINILKGLK